jgi:hypothetical protein
LTLPDLKSKIKSGRPKTGTKRILPETKMCKLVRRIFSSLQNFDAIALLCDAGIKAQYSKYERELRYWQIRIVM